MRKILIFSITVILAVSLMYIIYGFVFKVGYGSIYSVITGGVPVNPPIVNPNPDQSKYGDSDGSSSQPTSGDQYDTPNDTPPSNPRPNDIIVKTNEMLSKLIKPVDNTPYNPLENITYRPPAEQEIATVNEQSVYDDVRDIKSRRNGGTSDEIDIRDEVQNLKKHILSIGGVDNSNLVRDNSGSNNLNDAEDTDGETQEYTPHGSGSRSKKDKNDRDYVAPLPTPVPIPQFIFNTNWNTSPIPSLTMPDGATGLPSAQAEVYLGTIPGQNKGLILQTVVMQSNNKSYNRYATVDLSTGNTSWGQFSAPIDLSVYKLPSTVSSSATIEALGLTFVPSNKMIQTVFVNNEGYSRYLDFVINADSSVSFPPTGVGEWHKITLPGAVSGTTQAYDYAYFSQEGGFYLETYVVNNNFYHRFLPASASLDSRLKRIGTTQWYGPLQANTLPGSGDVITYSYYVINQKNKVSQAFWKTSGGYFRDLYTTSVIYPKVLPINQAWQGPITSLTMPGNTVGKPAAQAEVYLGKIPGQNKGLIYQSIVMEVNNNSYNRYGTIDLATGIIQWGTFEGPIDFTVYRLPSSVTGTIKGLGLTYVPGNKLVQTVIINNKGYSRTLDYSVSSNGTLSFPNPNNNWVEIPLSGLVTGDIQAYDLAYYGHDGGFYLETVAKNNTLYYRMFRPNSDYSNVVSKEAVLPWSPVVFPSTSFPGSGDIITYSYFVINEKDKVSQAYWKTSGGYFRDLRASSINYYDYSDLVSTDKFDVNKDGRVDILDIIFLIQELFN